MPNKKSTKKSGHKDFEDESDDLETIIEKTELDGFDPSKLDDKTKKQDCDVLLDNLEDFTQDDAPLIMLSYSKLKCDEKNSDVIYNSLVGDLKSQPKQKSALK